MNASHTPGPWHVNELNVAQEVDPYYIFIEPGVAVIERKVEGKDQHDIADARLIAAAPDLLNALTGLLMSQPGTKNQWTDAARAAIKAAKGEA